MYRRNFLRHLSTSCGSKNQKPRNVIDKFEKIVDEGTGKRSKVQGWVKVIRKMKDKVFLEVNDGMTFEHTQVVIKKIDAPKNLSYDCSVFAAGEIAYAPNGRYEIRADEVRILGSCEADGSYPLAFKKEYILDELRQLLHLRARTRDFSSLLRLRSLASLAISKHMNQRGFINIHTPILTSNDCEGAGEVFTVVPESRQVLDSMKKSNNQPRESIYFDAPTYLTVSGQLQLETMARTLSKVYTFGPTFRAENSKSRMHLSEFYMIEAEEAFVTDIRQLTNEAELLFKAITRALVEEGASDMRAINAETPGWLDKDFRYMTYDEAVDVLEKHKDKLSVPVRRGSALSKEHELFLVNYNEGIPVFVINWPKEIKPFYMKECSDDPSKVAAMDLLAPVVGEVFGGSLREDNYQALKKKIPVNADLDWYLDLRKYGNVPTGGFGMGYERFLQVVLGIPNIRDVIPFPRWPHNCSL
ncbi:probable asparagine--tRNA ligase, mitochondrial [Microplitis mediator]|uniref:probable asparagine--tRNA ligase, mitochondrial n=1 Tax=Microplitis mediator TaxID=375433 RepID=UPI002556DC5A|nr:probable asparagine--tRNA ligase, mitochondrial [Microplitis mediator]